MDARCRAYEHGNDHARRSVAATLIEYQATDGTWHMLAEDVAPKHAIKQYRHVRVTRVANGRTTVRYYADGMMVR